MALAPSAYSLLPQERQEAILKEAKEKGAWPTALKYAKEVGMKDNNLWAVLRRRLVGKGQATRIKKVNGQYVKERVLSQEELDFIERLREGKATLEETSRFVAANVFEQMLKYPDRFQFLDFFRSELLKIKKEENEMRESWAKELINRMFQGKLPPKNCPKCGQNLSETFVEGEIIHEPVQLPDSVTNP